METFPLYLIPLLPLLGAAVNLLVGKRMGRDFASAVALTSVGGACLLGWQGAYILWRAGEDSGALRGNFFDAEWISATELVTKASLHVHAGLVMDHLSAVMVLVITTVGFLIHLYSTS